MLDSILPKSALIVNHFDGIATLRHGLVNRIADRHCFVAVKDRGVRLDVALNAINKVRNLALEGMVRHIAAVRGNRGECKIFGRTGILLRRINLVVLDRAVGAKEPTVETIGRIAVE